MTPLISPTPLVEAFIVRSTGWIVLNRPERRNALNAEMWAAIPPLMKSLDEAPDVRAIVIRGSGREAFAAGAGVTLKSAGGRVNLSAYGAAVVKYLGASTFLLCGTLE